MAYLTGEARARLDAFKAVMVKHAHLSEVDAVLSLAIEEHADSTHVLLCGPGGVGKSTVLKGVTERFTREEPNRAVVPIVLLEPIPSDTGPYVRLDYYRQIVAALKGHILVKELYVNVTPLMTAPKSARVRADSTEWLDMREAAEQALIRAHVKAVLLDEGHRLMRGGGRYTTDEQLEWLKSLTNRTNVLHVLTGPYELFRFCNTQGQLARRGRDLHFARYHVERADVRKEFVAAVKYLLERVLLGKPGKAGNGQANPRLGGKMPAPPQRAQSAQAGESVPARASLPQVAPKPTKARVGQRGPGRDPVGETSAPSVRTAIGCTFTDVIAVTPSQMEAVACSRVECPTCLATRDIHPRGAFVKFPWHPRRTTGTPNHGKRWVRRGSIWELSD
jgi:AAA domain